MQGFDPSPLLPALIVSITSTNPYIRHMQSNLNFLVRNTRYKQFQHQGYLRNYIDDLRASSHNKGSLNPRLTYKTIIETRLPKHDALSYNPNHHIRELPACRKQHPYARRRNHHKGYTSEETNLESAAPIAQHSTAEILQCTTTVWSVCSLTHVSATTSCIHHTTAPWSSIER